VAIPRDFKVKMIPRDGMDTVSDIGILERCLEEARMRTENYYKEEQGVDI
jgi:phenylacetate 2-hydroxylase